MFGHDANIITPRKSPFTYAFDRIRPSEREDPENKRFTSMGLIIVQNSLKKMVTTGDSVDVGKTV